MRCATAVRRQGPAGSTTRLLLFVAASVALHGVTLGVGLPLGTGTESAAAASTSPTLHATLVRSTRDAATQSPALPEETHDEAASGQPPAHDAPAPAQASAAADGLNLPLADRWYAASELDVRAEPLDPVEFDYPSSPEGGRLIGRVELALFIDERGYVRKTKVLKAEPESVFVEAALKGWLGVRFSPAMRGGAAVKSEKIVQVDFQPEVGR